MFTVNRLLYVLVCLFAFNSLFAQKDDIKISESKTKIVTIKSKKLTVDFDLNNGTYSIGDAKGTKLIKNAYYKMLEFKSNDKIVKHKWEQGVVKDNVGSGKSLIIKSNIENQTEMMLQFIIYENKDFVVLQPGVDNSKTDFSFRLMDFHPMIAEGYENQDFTNLQFLDGNGGGEVTHVKNDSSMSCRNNILAKMGAENNLRFFVMGGLTYYEFEKFCKIEKRNNRLLLDIWMLDPIGKLIDANKVYLSNEKFYIHLHGTDPYEALEQYAEVLKQAQGIEISLYTFPTVDLWYSSDTKYGGGPQINDTRGGVWEMEQITKSGFLKYSPVAIRLVPDNYDQNNQQGWWDDEHWQMYGEKRWSVFGPHYKKPYETSKKYADAIISKGGIPFTYIQTARRSEDFAQKFPEYMLFNDQHRLRYRQKLDNKSINWWTDLMLWSYDFTDEGFQKHLQTVYGNLKNAGFKGIMYDYPEETGWCFEGGFDDKYATTASAYRKIFEIPNNTFGSTAYLQERNLRRGSDVALGTIASQRVWTDTDQLNPEMVTRCGLRWYKTRKVLSFDMDSKNPNKAFPDTIMGPRAMFQMAYVVSGRLLLGCSFSKMTKSMLFSLSRTFPYHTIGKSARPLDAFSENQPKVYDFDVNEKWHQLSFWNNEYEVKYDTGWFGKVKIINPMPRKIGVEIGKTQANGGMGLNASKEYYFFEFWNHKFMGKIAGNLRFEDELKPGEARMYAVREVEKNPQILATNRHIMQGMLDVKDVKYDEKKLEMTGKSEIVADDIYKLVFSANGLFVGKIKTGDLEFDLEKIDQTNGIYQLVFQSKKNETMDWSISFSKEPVATDPVDDKKNPKKDDGKGNKKPVKKFK